MTSGLAPRKLQRCSRGSPEHLSQEPSGCHTLLLDASKAIEHLRQEPSDYHHWFLGDSGAPEAPPLVLFQAALSRSFDQDLSIALFVRQLRR